MKKTIIGQVMTILIGWSLYGIYLAKKAFYAAYDTRELERSHLILLLISAATLFLIMGVLLWNKLRDDKKRKFRYILLSANFSVSEEDERDEMIINKITRTNAELFSNVFILVIAALAMLINNHEISVDSILLVMVLMTTLDGVLFLYKYLKVYRV